MKNDFEFVKQKSYVWPIKYMKKLILISALISIGLWACKEKTDDEVIVTPKTLCDSVTYNTMVKPILTKSCNIAGCHPTAGSLNISSYTTARKSTEDGSLLNAIKHQLGGSKNMPAGAPQLSVRQIAIFDCWASKGFPE